MFAATEANLDWTEFAAEGFPAPVTGVVYAGRKAPECGVPLGGIDTGCLDLEATGLLGFASIFNSLFPRRGPINTPFLGLTMGDPKQQTWVLTTLNLQNRETTDLCNWYLPSKRFFCKGIRTCSDILYWGHYPVVDMEFETTAPVSVGLRAWSPFIPGDVGNSSVPGAVFEVHVRNTDKTLHAGAITFSFPGPSVEEAGTASFGRRDIDQDCHGVEVISTQASYALAVVDGKPDRIGGDLGVCGHDWQAVRDYLPPVVGQAGTSLSVEFSLEAGEEKVIRFVLAWHAPQWMGGGRMTAGGNAYYHMYATRFAGAADTAMYLAQNRASLLGRVLAWQEVVYRDAGLPDWLRDSLVNTLHLITEVSVWGQAKPPIGDWCRPEDGIYGMNESPRWCPQIECIPCSYIGNLPVVYFFPQLALSTLRACKAYQYESGAAPWVFGGVTVGSKPYELALPSPGYAKKPQTTLDGLCYVEMIDKLWQRTGDMGVVREFYESMKKNTVFTMNLRPGSGDAGIVSMPAGNNGYDWYECCDLFGIVPHIGGVHLAELRLARRMADAMGDKAFAEQCEDWIERGSMAMEEHGWAGTHYMLFNELETGRRSDIVMAYQLDGEWITRFHGLKGVFRPDRVKTTLETIEKSNLSLGGAGAVTFCRSGASTLDMSDWDPGYWGSMGVHPPGTFVLGMIYIYQGQEELGLAISRKTIAEVVKRGWYWDWPVVIDGIREHEGHDYYQNLMLWSLPAALAGGDLATPCEPDGLVDRIIRAGAQETIQRTASGIPSSERSA